MKPRFTRKGFICLFATIFVFSLFTAVWLQKKSVQSVDLSSFSPEMHLSCQQSDFAKLSLGQYFETRQASHFYEVIQTAIGSKPGARAQLAQTSQLLNQLNQSILNPQGEHSYAKIENWISSYSGAENFRYQQGTTRKYDLNGFFSYVEKDVHKFFYSLLKEALLPKNLWAVTEPNVRGSAEIQSVGVRLGDHTWARIGLFPNKWHLHVFKSPPIEGLSEGERRPKDHLPVQALSLRVVDLNHLEVVDGFGKVRMRAKSSEELELTPLCEWMAGEGRREQQLSQRVLKSL